MGKRLRKIFFILVGLCVPLGFFTENDHALYWWHNIPSLDVIVGGAGALLLLGAKKFVSSFASKKVDFYD